MERKKNTIKRLQARMAFYPAMATLLCSLLLIASCTKPALSFNGLLLKIDNNKSAVTMSVLEKAAKLSSGNAEKLRILKRARLYGPEVYGQIARLIQQNGQPLSENTALSLLDAFLASSFYKEAFLLFEKSIDPKSRPGEYTELLVRAFRAGCKFEPRPEALTACFDSSNDARFMQAAAVFAMHRADSSMARSLLLDAERKRQTIPDFCDYRLFWDTGLFDLLLSCPDSPGQPLFYHIKGDAYLATGQQDLARLSYKQLIENYPLWSWKPYAAMARLASKSGADRELTAEYYYKLMMERFPEEENAKLEYLNMLREQDKYSEAEKLLGTLQGERAQIAALSFKPAGKKLSAAIELASAYPDSSEAIQAALESYVMLHAWQNFADLWKEAQKRGIVLPKAMFWELADDVLSGSTDKALEDWLTNAKDFRLNNEYLFSYNEGLLLAYRKRYKEALNSFARAVNFSVQHSDKAKALVLAGDSAWLASMKEAAASAYEDALDNDPYNLDARSRLAYLRQYKWD